MLKESNVEKSKGPHSVLLSSTASKINSMLLNKCLDNLPSVGILRPITRTVSDAVYVLDAIVGFDENDEEATKEAAKHIPSGGYIQFLKSDGLRGKRLGVVRNPFVDSFIGSSVFRAFEDHLNMLRYRSVIERKRKPNLLLEITSCYLFLFTQTKWCDDSGRS